MPYRRHNKFNAKRTVLDGITFHSAGEAQRYAVLKLRERAGEIKDLVLQPRFDFRKEGRWMRIRSTGFPNGRIVHYTADFSYTEIETNEHIVEDFKGMDTYASRMKRALVELFHDIKVRVVT